METKDDAIAENDDEHFFVRSLDVGDWADPELLHRELVRQAGDPELVPLCILDDERGGGSSICDNLGSSRNPPDLDDDGAPNRIDLSVNPTVVSEARFEQGPVDVMATLVGGVTRSVDTVVTLSLDGGSATQGADYTVPSPSPPGNGDDSPGR